MLSATLLKNSPNIELKDYKGESITIDKKEYNICKDLFNINSINSALNTLELRYKVLNEIDIYNIIEHILANNRKD